MFGVDRSLPPSPSYQLLHAIVRHMHVDANLLALALQQLHGRYCVFQVGDKDKGPHDARRANGLVQNAVVRHVALEGSDKKGRKWKSLVGKSLPHPPRTSERSAFRE